MTTKKELKQRYKQTLPPMGIYRIKNLVNGKIFIAGAKDLHGKINSARFQLQQGSHMNRDLQKDYTQQGDDKFSFDVLDHLEPKSDPLYDYTKDLAALEAMWLEELQPFDEQGYNRRRRQPPQSP